MPTVASVSGGWIGCPSSPRQSVLRFMSAPPWIAPDCSAHVGRERPGAGVAVELDLLGLEEEVERRVLGQIDLDLGHARARPVLDPGLAEVVFDVVKAAFAHEQIIGSGPDE